MSMYRVYFPYKESIETTGRVWRKAGIMKVGLFHVKIANLDRKDNITFDMWYPISLKDRPVAKALKGKILHMADFADREWLVRDWPWEH